MANGLSFLRWSLFLFSLFREKLWEVFRCFSFSFDSSSMLFPPSLNKELLIRLWSDIGWSGSTRYPRTKTGHSNEPSKEVGGLCPGTGPKEVIFSFKLVSLGIHTTAVRNIWYQILNFLFTQFEFLSDSEYAV